MNTEEQEQILLVEWLELKKATFSALPLSTYTKSWSVKARNKRTGVRSGVPDMIILWECQDGLKRVVFIEMKREKRGVISESQKKWIKEINECEDVGAFVAKGFLEAKEILESL